jgi:hypothetical protein
MESHLIQSERFQFTGFNIQEPILTGYLLAELDVLISDAFQMVQNVVIVAYPVFSPQDFSADLFQNCFSISAPDAFGCITKIQKVILSIGFEMFMLSQVFSNQGRLETGLLLRVIAESRINWIDFLLDCWALVLFQLLKNSCLAGLSRHIWHTSLPSVSALQKRHFMGSAPALSL